MGTPTTQDWIDSALSGELVVQLGQIDKPTQNALNRLVRQGKLARCRGSWSRLLIGPLKTIWAAPHALWAAGQLDSVSEATPAFFAAAEAARASLVEAA